MSARTYHIGFIKRGKTLIVQMAPSKDQLSCETWQYKGERITDVKTIREGRNKLLAAVNQEHGTKFEKISIDVVAANDFTAGHTHTMAQELHEMLA